MLVSRAQSIKYSYWYDSSLGQFTYIAAVINAMIGTLGEQHSDNYLWYLIIDVHDVYDRQVG